MTSTFTDFPRSSAPLTLPILEVKVIGLGPQGAHGIAGGLGWLGPGVKILAGMGGVVAGYVFLVTPSTIAASIAFLFRAFFKGF